MKQVGVHGRSAGGCGRGPPGCRRWRRRRPRLRRVRADETAGRPGIDRLASPSRPMACGAIHTDPHSHRSQPAFKGVGPHASAAGVGLPMGRRAGRKQTLSSRHGRRPQALQDLRERAVRRWYPVSIAPASNPPDLRAPGIPMQIGTTTPIRRRVDADPALVIVRGCLGFEPLIEYCVAPHRLWYMGIRRTRGERHRVEHAGDAGPRAARWVAAGAVDAPRGEQASRSGSLAGPEVHPMSPGHARPDRHRPVRQPARPFVGDQPLRCRTSSCP